MWQEAHLERLLMSSFCCLFVPSAIIEHTNKVIFLEDDDVAAIKDGSLTIHRIHRNVEDSTVREVTTLKMEIQQIMKGDYYIILYFYLQ